MPSPPPEHRGGTARQSSGLMSDRWGWLREPGAFWLWAAALLATLGPWLAEYFEAILEIGACLAAAWAAAGALRHDLAVRWPWRVIAAACLALAGRGLSVAIPSSFGEVLGYVSLGIGYALLAIAFVRLAAGRSVGWNTQAALDTAVALCGLVGSLVILRIGQYGEVKPKSLLVQATGLLIGLAGLVFTVSVIYGALARHRVPVFYQRLLAGAVLATVLALLRGLAGPSGTADGPGGVTMITVTALALASALGDPALAQVGDAIHDDGVAWSLRRTSGLFALSTLAVVAAAARAFPESAEGVFVLFCLYLIIALLLTRASLATRAQQKLFARERQLMTTDSTTGLPNILGLLDALDDVAEPQLCVVLVRIWLDDLDDMSDTAGRPFADSIERNWSKDLAARLPSGSQFFRIAVGDYAVVVPDSTVGGTIDAHSVRIGIGELADRTVTVDGSGNSVNVRTSTAAAPLVSITRGEVEDALALAALAHRDPRHRGGIGSEVLRESWARRTELGQQLLADRRWRGLVLYAQPFIRLDDESVVGYECLTRWRSPTGELVPPNVFLPIVEALSLMPRIDRAIVTSALAWEGPTGGAPGILSINVDPESLMDDQVVDALLAAVEHPGWGGAELWLEVLERHIDASSSEIYGRLGVLADAGFCITIDDFSAGASTLTRLDRLRASVLKLDRALVAGLDRDKRRQSIVSGLVGIAADLGVRLVVEGIETPAERDTVRQLGCSIGQGFLWARPGPLSSIPSPGDRLGPQLAK